MSKRKPKTGGLEWLYHSLAAFNGSGYADKSTPDTYLLSYKAFKTLKKAFYAHEMLDQYPDEALEIATKLCQARDAGHRPSPRNLARFNYYYERTKL